jgi:hypothetical protein
VVVVIVSKKTKKNKIKKRAPAARLSRRAQFLEGPELPLPVRHGQVHISELVVRRTRAAHLPFEVIYAVLEFRNCALVGDVLAVVVGFAVGIQITLLSLSEPFFDTGAQFYQSL